MDGLIIAAGQGTRIRALSASKPLTPVCGMALLEIGLRQFAAAGLSRAIVVTGYRAADIEEQLPAFSRAAGIDVCAVRAADWTQPNGHSVLAGAAMIRGDFLLAMADHIFDAGLLRRLIRQANGDRGVTLAVDRRIDSPLIDPDDATYVRTDIAGRIVAIGKDVRPADAVDCGAFLATGELFSAIGQAIAAGRPGSLSDGMQFLANHGRAATMDIGKSWWLDVDDPKAHMLAEEQAPRHLAEVFSAVAQSERAGVAR